MDVFDLRNRLVEDYARYTRSFIKIADPANYLAGARAKKILILVGFLEGFEAGEDETYP